jgi:hypothetical protein
LFPRHHPASPQVTDQPFSTNFSGALKYMVVGVYSGGWVAGQPHGEGRFRETRGGGLGYQGGWRNGQMHGQGTLTWADGRVAYSGLWKDGKPVK